MILKTDCKHFPGDRPCYFNKQFGTICTNCENYSPSNFKIIVLKFDAIGDVLRTTSILHAIKEKYPDSHITWLTKKNASEIFANNPHVDKLLFIEDASTLPTLMTTKFNVLIHPDSSLQSASFATIISSVKKYGFVLSESGNIIPLNSSAEKWLEMGAFDQVKKVNQNSYQKIIHDIAELDYNFGEIIINLSESEIAFRDEFFSRNNLSKYKTIIGLNTGAGSRWQLKQWTLDGFIQLIEKLSTQDDICLLLYGGPDEKERNEKIKSLFPFVIDTGTNNSIREFFSLVDISHIFITGDTMGLHAATALRKKVISFFGPTSSNEIESYGRVVKIVSDLDCLVCYKSKCDFNPNCMNSISVEKIYSEIEKLI